MIYRDIEKMLEKIKKDTNKVIAEEVVNEVKTVYSEEVDFAYSEYTPLKYKRRYDNGGFADENNWDVSVKQNKNNTYITLTNEAKPIYERDFRLDEIIEYGLYDTEVSPSERPVYARTLTRLEDKKVVSKVLSKSLAKLGYKIVKS